MLKRLLSSLSGIHKNKKKQVSGLAKVITLMLVGMSLKFLK